MKDLPSYFIMPLLKAPSTQEIIDHATNQVCDAYDVTLKDLRSPKKTANLAFPRQLLFYLLKKRTHLTLANIGKHLNKDHTAVLYAIRVIDNYLFTNDLGRGDEIKRYL